jgi:hypothetical protein
MITKPYHTPIFDSIAHGPHLIGILPIYVLNMVIDKMYFISSQLYIINPYVGEFRLVEVYPLDINDNNTY